MDPTFEVLFSIFSSSPSLGSRLGTLMKRIVVNFAGKVQTSRSPSRVSTFLWHTAHVKITSGDTDVGPSP